MNPETSHPIYDNSALYLVQLEELITEMNEGMNAIASNSVEMLKESVARQEFLCANLVATSVADGSRLLDLSHPSPPRCEAVVKMAIWRASNTVRHLNLQYAALLKHSGKTITMLSALCNTHLEIFTEPHSTWSKQQTWSCEI